MSQLLTLEFSDDVYATLQQQADAVGLSVAELIVTSVVDEQNRLLTVAKQPEAQPEEASQRLLSYAGAISLGYI
ncbi:hypothetical protein [aff. Roholtiella sp. LEGE 12411]|uniref:hypothetical protein n=1 Tax=aff. Roholtiella sp. LEGE 12411 TaxID=1828822 RepID=UPI00187F5C39|nr:hypothetical protein [aff. Roholtiella sp. LEGE 12411]MBE9034343.1 hypothetical protein [aff. Roholtiella sp. LEGE 12411]